MPSPTDFAKEKEKKTKKKVKRTSLIIGDDFIVEQVYINDVSKFAVYNSNDGKIIYKNKFEDWFPLQGEEIGKKAILLPNEALEYGTDEKLDNDIKTFILKWLDIPDDILQFALWNIKRSWVYDKFHTLNYLRALGDTGTGKSRFLNTLGYLHYKPISTSGATTSAPVFRIIEKWHGTLVMDEADFNKSDESQDIIKIINQGYEKGNFVMRCDREKDNAINFFDPYGPKILATRKTFYDKAVESRCITHVMKGGIRKNIPLNLNKYFFEEVQILRNKLLMWRFRNYHKINPEKEIEFDMGDLEPRVEQVVSSFINLFGNDEKQLKLFKEFMKKYQEELIDERRSSFAGSVVSAIHSLIEEGIIDISSQDIIEEGHITDFKGNLIKPRSLTSTLKSLGFEKTERKRVGEKIKRCIPINDELLKHLFKRYGVNGGTVVTVVAQQAIFNNKGKNPNFLGGGGYPYTPSQQDTKVT